MKSPASRGQVAIAGHARSMECLGYTSRGGRSPGWVAKCKCGWEQAARNYMSAKQAYAAHRATAEPFCKCGEKLGDHNRAIGATHSCKKCVTRRTREWAAENPKAFNDARRRSFLKKRWNMTVEEYDKMFDDQGKACMICRSPFGDSRGFKPHIDHCHKTGKIRGILCGSCNMGLGHFNDDTERMIRAIAYLATS